MMKFLLNSGHGQDTKGKRSPFVPPGVFEYDFNRSVVMAAIEIAKTENIHITHIDPEREAVPLREIVRRVNDIYKKNGNCIFISIHANAAPGGENKWIEQVQGATVLVSPNASQISRELGLLTVNEISEKALMKNRGVRERNLYVLNKTICPAILSENGFMTHPDEATKLASKYWQRKIAEAHVQAIKQWLERRLV